jgi:hypothetical protein
MSDDTDQALATVVALLPVARVVPVVAFTTLAGRYRATFAYDPDAVATLKAAVPSPMRRWVRAARCWEVSAEWMAPLAGALCNAGHTVTGLTEGDVEAFGCFSAAAPIGEAGHRAYLKGMCTGCEQAVHRPGGTQCDDCHRSQLHRQARVKAALAVIGAMPYPQARPSVGSAIHIRAPLEIDAHQTGASAHDYSAAIDASLTTQPEGTCPICQRKPSKGAAVHAGCRTRLLHVLTGRPFTKARNEAFQDGLCSVCAVRAHTGSATCAHCASLVGACTPTTLKAGGAE